MSFVEMVRSRAIAFLARGGDTRAATLEDDAAGSANGAYGDWKGCEER